MAKAVVFLFYTQGMNSLITLIVADDHPIFLEGLELLLNRLDWLEILGVATDRDETLAVIEQYRPNIALIALSMFGTSTQHIAEFIEKSSTTTQLVALTILEDEDKAQQLLTGGLSGYVLKDIAFDGLLAAIKHVSTECQFMPSSISKELIPPPVMCYTPHLTRRELEVLARVAKGDRNKEIAYKLDITQRTVCFHMSNCFAKLEVSNRTEAIIKALSHGLLDIE
ncbi:response regulator transcription factor [Psychrobacter sp.]|uniref:response regulator transcription factor n=1 Tax=Psychrobacter sp. TaxID=56811 RepID=UPI003F96A7EC